MFLSCRSFYLILSCVFLWSTILSISAISQKCLPQSIPFVSGGYFVILTSLEGYGCITTPVHSSLTFLYSVASIKLSPPYRLPIVTMLHTRFTNGLYTSTCNTQQTFYQADLVSLSCPSLFDNMHLWLSNSNQSFSTSRQFESRKTYIGLLFLLCVFFNQHRFLLRKHWL